MNQSFFDEDTADVIETLIRGGSAFCPDKTPFKPLIVGKDLKCCKNCIDSSSTSCPRTTFLESVSIFGTLVEIILKELANSY